MGDAAAVDLSGLVSQFLGAVSEAQDALSLAGESDAALTPADLAYSLDEAVSGYLEAFDLPVADYPELEQHVLHALSDELHEQGLLAEHDTGIDLDACAVLDAYSSCLNAADSHDAGDGFDGLSLL